MDGGSKPGKRTLEETMDPSDTETSVIPNLGADSSLLTQQQKRAKSEGAIPTYKTWCSFQAVQLQTHRQPAGNQRTCDHEFGEIEGAYRDSEGEMFEEDEECSGEEEDIDCVVGSAADQNTISTEVQDLAMGRRVTPLQMLRLLRKIMLTTVGMPMENGRGNEESKQPGSTALVEKSNADIVVNSSRKHSTLDHKKANEKEVTNLLQGSP